MSVERKSVEQEVLVSRFFVIWYRVFFSVQACRLVIFPSISRKQSVGVNWKSEQRVFQRTVKGSLTLMRASSKFRVKQDLF